MKNLNTNLVSREELDTVNDTCVQLKKQLDTLTYKQSNLQTGLWAVGAVVVLSIIGFVIILL
jgi:BMFP domain-containing protein YqiC